MMKKLMLILCSLFMIGGFCFATDQVEGYWLSVDDKTGKVTASWEIYQQDGKLFGKILAMPDYPADQKAIACKESYRDFPAPGNVKQMTVAGTPWIFGLGMDRAGQWSGGNVVDPQSGNMYKCRISFHPADGGRYKADTLEMRGEIGLGIGRSQFWQRTSREEALAIQKAP